MNAIATRLAPSGAIWDSLPFDLIVSVLAVILAGGLTAAGLMP